MSLVRRILLKAVQATLRTETPDELAQWVFSSNINNAHIAPKLRGMHQEGDFSLAEMVNKATNMENDYRMRRTTLDSPRWCRPYCVTACRRWHQ